jgi:hypothetical protein
MDNHKLNVTNLINEREFERMKAELSAARIELESFKSDLVQQVADAKVQIGDQALEKMSKAFSEFRLWAAFFIVVGGAVVGLSFYQIYSVARQTIETKITDWLSFDKKGALLKDSLEQIRTRVVLDGLVTKMTRNGTSSSYIGRLELSESEKSRLVAFMLEPETSETDFRDGARVLEAYIGPFYFVADSKLDELLSKTLTGAIEKDSARPIALLESLKRYPGIALYAKAILAIDGVPDRLRMSSFSALAAQFGNEAKEYAAKHLLTEKNSFLQEAEAKVLADDPNAQPTIDKWLLAQSKLGKAAEAKLLLVDSLAARISGSGPSFDAEGQKFIVERTAQLLIEAIRDGANLVYEDTFYPSVSLGMRYDKGRTFLRTPETFIDRKPQLMESVTRLAKSSNLAPEAFVRSFTSKGERGEMFGLRANLNSATLTGEAFGPIDARSVAGPVLLVADDKSKDSPIAVSFRSKEGAWVTDKVKSFQNFYSASLDFAYDQTVIQMARSQNIRASRGLDD